MCIQVIDKDLYNAPANALIISDGNAVLFQQLWSVISKRNRNLASYKTYIELHCKDCGYDSLNPGTWREQIAACPATNCNLHSVRAVPRHCMRGGQIDPAAIAAVIAKLEAIDRRRAEEGR